MFVFNLMFIVIIFHVLSVQLEGLLSSSYSTVSFSVITWKGAPTLPSALNS